MNTVLLTIFSKTKTMGTIVLITFVYISFFSNPSFAYKPENHKKITAKAWPTFHQCLPKWGLKDHPISKLNQGYLGEALTQSTWDEDKKDPLRRSANWHFLNEEIDSRRYILGIQKSMLRIFERIEKKLMKAGSLPTEENALKERFTLAGRALHYIEDVTVPAHVVPVYHGPRLPNVGRETRKFWLGKIEDEIDSYPEKKNLSPAIKSLDKFCGKARTMALSAIHSAFPLQSILKVTADNTRKTLEKSIDAEKFGADLTWRFFWKKPTTRFFWFKSFFGEYNLPSWGWRGDINKADCSKRSGGLFGNMNICYDGKVQTIDEETYKAFVQKQLNNALKSDVAILYALFLKDTE